MQLLWKTMEISQKLRRDQPYDSAFLLPSIHLKYRETLMGNNIMCLYVLHSIIIIAKVCKQPKRSQMDERIENMVCVHTHIHTHCNTTHLQQHKWALKVL